MNEHALALMRAGFAPHEAYMIYQSFMREFSMDDFKKFLDSQKGVGDRVD